VLGRGATELPLSKELAVSTHRRLLLDHVLDDGECRDPEDLSSVADAVFEKLGSQREMVSRLPISLLRHASPNEGTLIAAALLIEGVVRFLVTLNYDLSIPHALSLLGARDEVAILKGPEAHAELSGANVVFLHRNVEADPEDWVIRSSALDVGWQAGWEQVAAQMTLGTPVVVFAGLGTAVGVLVDTAQRMRAALAGDSTFVQVDPGSFHDSPYAEPLGLTVDTYIRMGWCGFMLQLGQRLVAEHRAVLESSCEQLLSSNPDWIREDVKALGDLAEKLGLIGLGRVRAQWMLSSRSYLPHNNITAVHIADLLLVIGLMTRELSATAVFRENGLVEVWRGDRRLALVAMGSGEGYRRWAQLAQALQSVGGGSTFAVASGFTGPMLLSPSPPSNIVRGDTSGNILGRPSTIPVVAADDLRSQPERLHSLVAA
jgi:hypothetical protein